MNIVRTALVAGMLGSVAMPALAQPVQAGNDAPYSVGAIAPRGDHHADHPMARGPQGRQTPDDRHGPEMGPPHGPVLWMVAGKLAAAEVALGITPDQQDAWRVVTSAVIAMAEAGPEMPMPGRDDAGPQDMMPPSEAADGARTPNSRSLMDLRGMQMMTRMIDGQIRRGEAAGKLQSALQGLSAVLTPDQVKTADRLLAELPHPGPDGRGGPHGHDRDGHGPGDRAFGREPHQGHHGDRHGPKADAGNEDEAPAE